MWDRLQGGGLEPAYIRIGWEEDSRCEIPLPFALRQRQSALGLAAPTEGGGIRWVPLRSANHREEDDDWLFSVSAREEVGRNEAVIFRSPGGRPKEFHRG